MSMDAGIEKAELLVQGVRALLDSPPLDEASSKAATGSEVSIRTLNSSCTFADLIAA